MRGGLALDSGSYNAVASASSNCSPQSQTATPTPQRGLQRCIAGGVKVVMFDFDGTLTATPGDRAPRKFKGAELKARTPLLQPWLRRLRDARLPVGIISKSSEGTILSALDEAGLREFFEGPILGKAVGFEGKAGIIRDMCIGREDSGSVGRGTLDPAGVLSALGPGGMGSVLLVDDDVLELARCKEISIQTYPAPESGGLMDEDFFDIFEGMGLETPPRPQDSAEIECLWTLGLVGEALGLSTEQTQVKYDLGAGLSFADHYEVQYDLSQLGRGAFGTCRHGSHIKSGTRCAIKFIRKEDAGPQYLKNFVDHDEYTFLLKVSRYAPHPNVVRQLDYIMGPRLVYNAMELLEGPDLLSHLQEKAPVTERFARRVTRQALEALKHIHGVFNRGLIHRDVKLENLRFRGVDPASDLVLIDFGLSCPAEPSQRRGIVGTSLYMAPEIFTCDIYNTQVDVWSAGVLFYILLTGMPPWSHDREQGMLPDRAVLNGTAVAAALALDVLLAAPPMAIELLQGLLLVDPRERCTAASALNHAWFHTGADEGSETFLSWDVGPRLKVESSAYVSVRKQTLESPRAKLDIMVTIGDLREDSKESFDDRPATEKEEEQFALLRKPPPRLKAGERELCGGDSFSGVSSEGGLQWEMDGTTPKNRPGVAVESTTGASVPATSPKASSRLVDAAGRSPGARALRRSDGCCCAGVLRMMSFTNSQHGAS